MPHVFFCLFSLQKEEPVTKVEPTKTRPKAKSISLFGGDDDEDDDGDLFGGGPPKPQPQKQQVGCTYTLHLDTTVKTNGELHFRQS